MALAAPDGRWSEGAAQLGLLWGSLLLAALSPFPIFGAWLVGYLGLWWALQIRWRPWPPRLGLFFLGIAATLAAIFEGPKWAALPVLEGLGGISTPLADRFRLEGPIAIAPPVVRDDLPQSYYVTAPGAAQVSARLGDRPVAGLPIGPGLFRLDFDPRAHGHPPDGPFAMTLEVDGEPSDMAMLGIQATFHPRALATAGDRIVGLSPETDQLFIVTPSGELELVSLGDGPTDLVITEAQDRAIVSGRHAEALWTVDLELGRVIAEARLDGPPGRLALRGDRLAVALVDRVEVYQLPTLSLVRRIALPRRPDRLAFGTGPDRLLASTREGHDLLAIEGDRVVDRLIFGRPVLAMASRGDRAIVAVSDHLPKGDVGANHEVEDQLLTIDLFSFEVIDRMTTAVRDERGVFGGAGPSALMFRGDAVIVAFSGTGDVARFEPGRRSLVATFEPGIEGLAQLGELTVVSVPWMGELRSSSGETLVKFPGPTSKEGELRRRGERGFYEATLSGISCGTCHPEDDSDQALHDIGHGQPRPTLSALGVARTAPYLRGAGYPSLASLDEFAHGVLGGYRVEVEGRSEALSAYVESLVRGGRRPPPTQSITSGYAAFCNAACNECHRPPAFTDLAQYPATLLFPERAETRDLLDTPSLLGVGDTGPWLHDGRAKTLESVFEDHDPRRQHGGFDRLGDEERARLFEFLQSL